MELNQYLQSTGLDQFLDGSGGSNNFVTEAFALPGPRLGVAELEALFTYDVPKVGDGGGCSVTKAKEDKKYNLAETLGVWSGDFEPLIDDYHTERIWRLNQVVNRLQELTEVDWLGIYRRVERDGEEFLLKEAYYGEFSRAEFPLTEEFAKASNNSTVGLTGKAVIVQAVDGYDGPYYQCDSKVQSEFCAPIFGDDGEVIGIIDAEAFAKNFFDEERIREIAKVCVDLGKVNLGI